ncbi:hypothetical protein ES708_13369 [subsurface metagenome]
MRDGRSDRELGVYIEGETLDVSVEAVTDGNDDLVVIMVSFVCAPREDTTLIDCHAFGS